MPIVFLADGMFDAAVAHSVLEHMTVEDAKRGLLELDRIVRPGGLVYVSFDSLEEDRKLQHAILADGTYHYQEGKRDGMLFHHYSDEEIRELLKGHQRQIIYFATNYCGERDVVCIRV